MVAPRAPSAASALHCNVETSAAAAMQRTAGAREPGLPGSPGFGASVLRSHSIYE